MSIITFCNQTILSNGYFEFKRGFRAPKITPIETTNAGTVVQVMPISTVCSHELTITEISATDNYMNFFDTLNGLLNQTGTLDIAGIGEFYDCTITAISGDDYKTAKIVVGGVLCFMQTVTITFIQQNVG